MSDSRSCSGRRAGAGGGLRSARWRQRAARGVLAAWAMLPLALPARGADRLESGKWESTVVADGQARKLSYCISSEEAASINSDTKTARAFAESKARKASEPCTFTSYEIDGETVSYTMQCGTRTITDKTEYRGRTSEGVRTISKEGQTLSMQISSRRVGESCQ